MKQDALRLQSIATNLANLLAKTPVSSASPGGVVKSVNPTPATPATGMSTGTVLAGLAAVTALGAGAWWYMKKEKPRGRRTR